MAVVFGSNEQTEHDVDVESYVRLANDVLYAERVVDEVEANLIFVDEPTIAELNARFMDANGPTDVLSFPIDGGERESGRSPDGGGHGPGGDDGEGDEPSLLGDVVICPAVAMRQAPEHAGTYGDEIALLVVHGLLHLLGMDHQEAEEAEEMESREQELLRDFWRELDDSTWSTLRPSIEILDGDRESGKA